MASNFYQESLPDYRDLENSTGNRPGYELYVCENDGGVGIALYPADEDFNTSEKVQAVFLTVDKAEDLAKSLNEAIERARSKNAGPRLS
jgi:hypothetical protein